MSRLRCRLGECERKSGEVRMEWDEMDDQTSKNDLETGQLKRGMDAVEKKDTKSRRDGKKEVTER